MVKTAALKFIFSGLFFSVDLLAGELAPIEMAIQKIQFCKEVTSESEAVTKAEIAATLIDPARCWTSNKWNLTVHRELIAQGFILDMFIPARFPLAPREHRLELFIWYSRRDGKKHVFTNSCELSDEAKAYVAAYPQPSC